MQENAVFIGMDISKQTIDICVLQGDKRSHHVIDNATAAIQHFFTTIALPETPYIGVENTGRYNWPLYTAMQQLNLPVYVLAPLHLKKSLGLTRGKNDKIDALRIAAFVKLHHQQLKPYTPCRKIILRLQVLLAERGQLIKIKKQLTTSYSGYNLLQDSELIALLTPKHAVLEATLNEQIKQLERHIEQLIASDEALHQKAQWIQSVQGVGKVLGWNLLVKTNEFKNITDPRKLACYAGVVPFEYSSGTSIRGKHKVSVYADKSLKTLLHLAAMSAIRLKGDLRDYYQRKVQEGKNKMSALNAVRNKIIHRVFAVIKHQRPYQLYLNILELS